MKKNAYGLIEVLLAIFSIVICFTFISFFLILASPIWIYENIRMRDETKKLK